MTSMHQSHHVQTYSSSGQNLDHNLDALLDDLQTSVSRPGTSMALAPKDNIPMLNGGSFGGRQINLPPGSSGYREITTTVTHETNGIPMTSREYQIEYLNPANSVTVAKERSSSPGIEWKNAELGGRNVSSYKTESYGYSYEEKTSDRFGRSQPKSEEVRTHSIENKSYPMDDSQGQNKSYQYSKTENYRSESTGVNKNLNDLENLLRELNDTPGPQPTMTSTPSTVRKEEHLTTRTLDTRSPARYDDSSNTIPKRSASTGREVTYSEVINQRSDRSQSPYMSSGGTPKVQQRTFQREVNTMEHRGHISRRDTPVGRDRSAEMSPTLRRRTPSPSREFRPATFSSYPISPKDTQRTVVSKSYSSNYSSTRRTPTPSSQSFDEPQPYRSPSPVSFPQKRSPSPIRKNVNRGEIVRSDSGRAASYQVSPPLSDPNSPTVITYKYTSHTSQHNKYPGGTYDDPDPSTSRPFPSVTPVPVEEQNPPKKLDELMASFQEPRQMASYATEYSSTRESEKQTVDLQRSPSSERNVRPSEVRISQTYSQSQYAQQPNQPHHSHHHHHHHHHKHHEHHERHHHQQQQPVQQQYQQQSYQQSYQQQGYQQQQENYAHQQYQQYQQYQQQQQQQQHVPPQTPVNEVITATGVQGLRSSAGAGSNAVATANSTKSVAGPPVYYPPGVELFAKKEEAMEQQMYGGKGKMKSKGKMKYKYESKEKSKEKSSSGVSAVPLCLPVCCAAPCVIM